MDNATLQRVAVTKHGRYELWHCPELPRHFAIFHKVRRDADATVYMTSDFKHAHTLFCKMTTVI